MPWRSRVGLIFLATVAVAGVLACGQGTSAQSPTWFRDVEPIVSEHCASCHEPGGVAQVPLLFAADDLAGYASAMPLFADAVGELDADIMPLWLADRTCRHYEHERLVSDAEKQLFRAFVKAGDQRGDPKDQSPAFVPAPLKRVDAALSPSAPYLPVAPIGATSDTRCFVLDPDLTDAKDVVGFDLHPGSQRVHRAALFVLQAALAASLDQADAGLGYACFGGPGADAALVGEYVPGVPAQEYPPGTGIRLPAGSALVLQISYDLQSGDPVPDRTEVELEYAEPLVPHPAHFEAIANTSFSIPPRATNFTALATFSVAADTTLWGIAPHLRSFGAKAHMALTQASGEACLLDVPRWDPAWEQSYFFAEPASVSLKPGDSLTLTCTWDNPGEVAVVSGSSADDEACVGYAYLSGN
jgi:Copper type II ascorbate-dependent monooxygenase, C-terminal domain